MSNTELAARLADARNRLFGTHDSDASRQEAQAEYADAWRAWMKRDRKAE